MPFRFEASTTVNRKESAIEQKPAEFSGDHNLPVRLPRVGNQQPHVSLSGGMGSIDETGK